MAANGLPLFLISCLACLEGSSPLLNKRVGPQVDRRTIVAGSEFLKLIISLALLPQGAGVGLSTMLRSLPTVLKRAGFPAGLYVVQNMLLQIAYPRLDSMVFSIIGQTKILFVALVGRLLLKKRYTRPQVLGLGMLTVAAVTVIETNATGSSERKQKGVGVAAQLTANVMSGTNSALVELAMRGASPLDVICEFALCGSCVTTLGIGLSRSCAPLLPSSSCNHTRLLEGWDFAAILAVLALALNGVATGFVIKRGGGISKAFASIGALFVSSMLQALMEGRPPSRKQLGISLPLTVVGIYIYSKN